jgi:cell division protein FtsZ
LQDHLNPPPPEAQPPFQIKAETPPYEFDPQGSDVLWRRPHWEKKYEPYETPTFMRRNKQVSLKKYPDEPS